MSNDETGGHSSKRAECNDELGSRADIMEGIKS